MRDARPTGVSERSTEPAEAVAVVVCTHTHERRPLLASLIDSISGGSVPPADVVIVVDRNRPLFEALSAHPWPLPVRVIESSGRGLAAARNAGWRSVSSPLVAFIDDDAIASPTWLEELVAAAVDHRADVVGGRIEPRWMGGEPEWYSPLLGWVVGCSYEGLPTTASPVRNVIGCNMLFRRALLERLGGFDPNLGRMAGGLAGCEETELCIRANRAGATVVLVPGAAVEQILPVERARFRYAVKRGWDEGHSKRQLVRLHGRVLGTEGRYTRLLVSRAFGFMGRGVLRRQPVQLKRAAALLTVLAGTAVSYVLSAVPRGSRTPI